MIFNMFINFSFPKPTIIGRFVAKRFYNRWVEKYLDQNNCKGLMYY